MIKILLISIIISLSVYTGYQAGDYHNRRYKFYKNLNKFNNRNLINLIGQKNSIKVIIDDFIPDCNSKSLISLLKVYLSSIINKQTFNCNNSDFSKDENLCIEEYFNNLGKNETKAEKQNLEYYEKIFTDLENSTKEKYYKYSTMFLKLSFLIGCTIVILII